MIGKRVLAALLIIVAFACIGLLIMSYVSEHWGPIGVAVVVITLFITGLFITMAAILIAFGLGLAHIFGKAAGPGAVVEVARTMRAGIIAEKAITRSDRLLPEPQVRPVPSFADTWGQNAEDGDFRPMDGGDFTAG